MAIDHYLDSRIVSGLNTIKIPFQIFIHQENPLRGEDWKETVTRTRNFLRQFSGLWYCLLLDSDVILEEWVIPKLVKYLDRFPQVGMVAISSRQVITEEDLTSHGHVNISCALVRNEVLASIPFRYKKGDFCECGNYTDDVRRARWGVHYACTDMITEIER